MGTGGKVDGGGPPTPPSRDPTPKDFDAALADQTKKQGADASGGGGGAKASDAGSGPPSGSGIMGTFRHVFDPRDPDPTQGRVELRNVKGKWFEVRGKNGQRLVPATGNYHYAVQNGRIYVSRYGHPEAAKGGRVAFAGDIRFAQAGVLERWDNGSGSYRPAAYFAPQAANQVGLPIDKFAPAGTAGPGKKVQLPVIQDTPTPRGGPAPSAATQGGPPANGGGAGQATPPSTTAKSASTPPVNVIRGRVTVEHTPGASDPKNMKLKNLDMADYPADKNGPVTRFFKDRPVVRAVSAQAAQQGAQYVKGKMMDAVEAHFSSTLENARAEFQAQFPDAASLVRDARIDERRQAYDAALRKLKAPSNARTFALVMTALSTPEKDVAARLAQVEKHFASIGGQPQVIRDFIQARETYMDAMEQVMEALPRYMGPLPDIAADISARGSVLQRAGKDLSDAFWSIMGSPLAGIPMVYYESFDIYLAAGVFERLGGQVQGFASEIRGRSNSYQTTWNKLDGEMMRLTNDIAKTQHFLGGRDK
jgi:hypothetical protein